MVKVGAIGGSGWFRLAAAKLARWLAPLEDELSRAEKRRKIERRPPAEGALICCQEPYLAPTAFLAGV